MNEYFRTNQSLWDQKTEIHKNAEFYNLQGFLAGSSSLKSIELEALGNVSGKSMLHLQCHFGQDSLSWARAGAKVTGVDFSAKAIELARSLNNQLNLDARFLQSDILKLDRHLEGRFDIVFTSYGVLSWLNDLPEWARIIHHFLEPGGIFYIVEFHPVLYLYDFPTRQLAYNYFFDPKPYEELVQGSYAAPDVPLQHKEYFWQHSMSEIIGSLLKAGLHLSEFQEYDYSPYNCFENMKIVKPGKYKFDNLDISFPHLFSLKLEKKE